MNIINKIKNIFLYIILVFSIVVPFSSSAIILDWTGSYEFELNSIYNTNLQEKGSTDVFHNLILKPDIKGFDGIRVKSWFQLASYIPLSNQYINNNFYLQKGSRFGFNNNKGYSSPVLSVRDLYLEVSHDFGFFKIGWKPHHFGLGIYYNNASYAFSPIYNLEGSAGFISWRGFILSDYYAQAMVHYINGYAYNIFVQGGFTKDIYGIEFMYKALPIGIQSDSQQPSAVSYTGIYGYYKPNNLSVQSEIGKTSDEVYGGFLDIDWQTPFMWMSVGLNLGVSTSKQNKTFYFDPSFSYNSSSFIAQYEGLKPKDYFKKYLGYSFNSAISLATSMSFLVLDYLDIKTIYAIHLDFNTLNILLSDIELLIKYKLVDGLVLQTGAGVLISAQNDIYVGAVSQVSISF